MKRIFLALFFLVAAQGYVPVPFTAGSSFGTVTADALNDMNTSSPGTTMTVAIANAGTISTNSGTSGCTVNTGLGSTQCSWTNLGTGFTVGSNMSACSNLGPVSLRNGSTYPAGSLDYNGFELAGSSNNQTISFQLGSSLQMTSRTIGFCFNDGPPNQPADSQTYDLTTMTSVDGRQIAVQLEGGTCSGTVQYGLRIESSLGSLHSPCVQTTPGTPVLISENLNVTNGGIQAATYTSGGSITGSSTQTCNVSLIGGGGSGATGTVALTGTNTIASGTTITLALGNQAGYTSTPTSATLSNGTATCSGTATVSSTLGGLGTLTVHNATTGAVMGTETAQINTDTTGIYTISIGNGESGDSTNPLQFQNVLDAWTSPPVDMYANW